MKKLFLIFFLCSCSNYEYSFPNIEDALDNICKPTDGYLQRKNENKTYILFGAKDNLSSEDIGIMDIGLYCLGYNPIDINTEITIEEMKMLIQEPVDFFYFSGHGNRSGTIIATDQVFNALTWGYKYAATNILFSACEVLFDTEVVKAFIGPSVQYVMGYTDVSYDSRDNQVAIDMLKEMKKGNSIPMSFYLASIKDEKLRGRWAIYQNSTSGLIEYSARSKTRFVE